MSASISLTLTPESIERGGDALALVSLPEQDPPVQRFAVVERTQGRIAAVRDLTVVAKGLTVGLEAETETDFMLVPVGDQVPGDVAVIAKDAPFTLARGEGAATFTIQHVGPGTAWLAARGH